MYQCEPCAHGALKVLGPLELELQIIVSHYVGDRNQTQVLLTGEPSL